MKKRYVDNFVFFKTKRPRPLPEFIIFNGVKYEPFPHLSSSSQNKNI